MEIRDKWYCFYHRKWHDKDESCYLNEDHYNIGNYEEFWRFIKTHKWELLRAVLVQW